LRFVEPFCSVERLFQCSGEENMKNSLLAILFMISFAFCNKQSQFNCQVYNGSKLLNLNDTIVLNSPNDFATIYCIAYDSLVPISELSTLYA